MKKELSSRFELLPIARSLVDSLDVLYDLKCCVEEEGVAAVVGLHDHLPLLAALLQPCPLWTIIIS
jgi:hypothetical protein